MRSDQILFEAHRFTHVPGVSVRADVPGTVILERRLNEEVILPIDRAQRNHTMLHEVYPIELCFLI